MTFSGSLLHYGILLVVVLSWVGLILLLARRIRQHKSGEKPE